LFKGIKSTGEIFCILDGVDIPEALEGLWDRRFPLAANVVVTYPFRLEPAPAAQDHLISRLVRISAARELLSQEPCRVRRELCLDGLAVLYDSSRMFFV